MLLAASLKKGKLQTVTCGHSSENYAWLSSAFPLLLKKRRSWYA
jgi:hypothetical protein